MNSKNNIYLWFQNYELAKKYYEYHGNLEISYRFKTKNGYEYDEEGTCLGHWVFTQRNAQKKMSSAKITEEQIHLLDCIGMRWKNIDWMEDWQRKYELAKKYYEYYGNLEVPFDFRTKNGINVSADGIALGNWIYLQRNTFKNRKDALFKDKIHLLEQIGMRWDNIDRMEDWLRKFELAKKYYEYYGNLEVSRNFRTKNGIVYDIDGVGLGNWICGQRIARKEINKIKISEEQIKLLDSIGMRWEDLREIEWLEIYKFATVYFEHYGNLKVPCNFKTNNGIDYDENGKVHLGSWISSQRIAKKGKSTNKITAEQVCQLDKIGMIWDVHKNLEEVFQICLQNTIPVESNIEILKAIPRDVFQTKILFLKDNGISLVDESGRLHEIFSLSQKKMFDKYGIIIPELVDKDYLDNKRKKIRNG